MFYIHFDHKHHSIFLEIQSKGHTHTHTANHYTNKKDNIQLSTLGQPCCFIPEPRRSEKSFITTSHIKSVSL